MFTSERKPNNAQMRGLGAVEWLWILVLLLPRAWSLSCDADSLKSLNLSNNVFGNFRCGVYEPSDCEATEKIAIVVPYRNRSAQLQKFLSYMNDFLMRQRRSYAIIITEQFINQTFNRGKLLNVGFTVANWIGDFHCVVFHDVDLLPTNTHKLYSCPARGTAEHLSYAIDRLNFRMPYGNYFGGVSTMRQEDFSAVNGYPNSYWGWGGEDDCIYRRIRSSNITVRRDRSQRVRYVMLGHRSNETGNAVNPCRSRILRRWRREWHRDGLITLDFSLVRFEVSDSHCRVVVDLREPPNSTLCSGLFPGNNRLGLQEKAELRNTNSDEFLDIVFRGNYSSCKKSAKWASQNDDDSWPTVSQLLVFVIVGWIAYLWLKRISRRFSQCIVGILNRRTE